MNVSLVSKTTGTALPITTPIVFKDSGGVFVDPEIIEADEDGTVIFKSRDEWNDNEMFGHAVTLATITLDEAIKLAKHYLNYSVYINNKFFGKNRGTLCAGFVKKRGSRTWLLPVTDEDAKAIIAGTKKIVYYTYNRGAKVIAA